MKMSDLDLEIKELEKLMEKMAGEPKGSGAIWQVGVWHPPYKNAPVSFLGRLRGIL